jgi:signal transduction histidine kinase
VWNSNHYNITDGKSQELQYCIFNHETKGILRIDVEDSGIGISEHSRKNLFAPFMSVESGISAKRGGTGLGLWLS